jgi:hypothetical protein
MTLLLKHDNMGIILLMRSMILAIAKRSWYNESYSYGS